jgi:hypothetical protein
MIRSVSDHRIIVDASLPILSMDRKQGRLRSLPMYGLPLKGDQKIWSPLSNSTPTGSKKKASKNW